MANFQPAALIEYDGRLLNGTDLLYDTAQGVRIWGAGGAIDNYSIGDTTTGGVDATYGTNNLAFGAYALNSVQGAGVLKQYNIAIGTNTLRNLGFLGTAETFTSNIAIGTDAAKNVYKLNYSVIIGPGCLSTYNSTTTAINNIVLVGSSLLKNATSVGTRTLAIGNNSLSATNLTSIGADNIILGNGIASLNTQSIGSSNIVIGNNTLGSSQLNVGSQNILIGNDSGGGGNALPSDLIYIGYNSGMTHTVAGIYSNICIGSSAGGSSQVDAKYSICIGTSTNTNGSYSTIIGYDSGASTYFNPGFTSYNTVLGANSAQALNAANNNIIIGVASGNNLTDGDYNIIIGDALNAQTATGSNNIDILTNVSTTATGIQFTNSSSTLKLLAPLVNVPTGRFLINGTTSDDNIPIQVSSTVSTTTTANIYTYYHTPTISPANGTSTNLAGNAIGIYVNPKYATNIIPNSGSSHYSGMQIITGATSALTTAIPDVRGLTISFTPGLYAATVAPTEYTHIRLTDPSLNGSTATYNIYSGSNSSTGKWNLYLVGTASNHILSTLLLGSAVNSGTGEILQVTGSALVSTNFKVSGVQINTSTKANTAWLASGTANSTTFLRGDGTWATATGTVTTTSIARTFALMGA